ncbi:uncharacterized protein LOC100908771 [Galendromus occidentalis]|uniref:Uncharacterized protein LOC100908771 n=1 Tax=Galendromus occidentalis TaxID=34638 RepID=A0AAJ6QP91_9ACAR|nr:uncharacterized protein LOC100908771 [Galendromus occidentalis]
MKSFVLLSAVAAVSFGTHSAYLPGHLLGHHNGLVHGRAYAHAPSHGHVQTANLVQTVHHGASINHGSGYGAPSGDLLGLHSFGYDGLSLAHTVDHGGFLPSYASHNLGYQLDYGLPQRSKLYGGYVGGFGGYAKGALESIQHLNHGGLKLQAPLLSYGGHRIAAPVDFGHAAHASVSHAPLSHYGGQLGVSGIGGTHYGLEYKKAKA